MARPWIQMSISSNDWFTDTYVGLVRDGLSIFLVSHWSLIQVLNLL